MEKRGQVSTFFIIGVILVVIVGVGVFYRTEIITKLSELQIVKGAALPPEAQKVHDFIIQCTKDTAKTGVELLGLQGGYIELPVDKVPQGNINLFSNKLEVIPGFRTAYWYYQKDNGLSIEAIPSKASMSQYLKDYIDANIEDCFDKFSAFPDYKIDYRKVVSEVNIKNDEVQLTLKMPMVVDIKGQKFNFDTFKTSLNVALGDLTEVATQIVENEMNSNFLEEKTEDMMVAYDEIPYSGSDLSCGKKTWLLEKVISDFKMILFENIPQIRIAYTDYSLPDESHKYFEWHVTKQKYSNINAILSYSKSWPFYLSVIPEEDGVLKAQQITDKMGDISFVAKSMFCMNDWHFVYDVKYPILVTLYDKQNDYTFQFAMQVVIERNQPRKATIIPDFETEKDTRYCSFTKTTKSTVYTYEEEGLEATTKPLDSVDIKYNCITHMCDVGATKLEGEDAFLTTEFPACIGGTIIAEKQGYHKAKETDIDSNKQFSMSLTLEKLVTMPVKIHVNRNTVSGEPSKDEQVIIELEEQDKDYRTMILYPEQKEVQLIPGTYKVKEYVTRTGAPIKILGKEIQNCVEMPKEGLLGFLGSTEKKCTSTRIPDVELTNLVTGGAEFEWDVSRTELYTSDYVKFYINANPTPKSLEELSKVDLKQENTLLPVFLNE